MAMIELKQIAKEYQSDAVVTPALSDINLKIEAGEFIAIMGASGSGKTTLLNIIGCMDAPTAGTYLFDGRDLSRAKENQLSSIRGRKIAFVFQHFALIDDYTVFENVEVPLLKQAMTKAERKKSVLTALQAVGIPELAKKKPTHISGGQKQRAAIARAIACGAEVILADEPTGALDSKTGKEIMGIFSELNARGKTIILITHDAQIASYAKRMITIQDGRILAMNKFKKLSALWTAICTVFLLSACSGNQAEYESVQGFELHFYPEEYQEAYREVSKALPLDAGTDYQLQIDAACDKGSLELRIVYQDENEKVFIVSGEAPCSELLTLPANTASEVTITVSIEPDTKGSVIGDLLAGN